MISTNRENPTTIYSPNDFYDMEKAAKACNYGDYYYGRLVSTGEYIAVRCDNSDEMIYKRIYKHIKGEDISRKYILRAIG